jgi:pimeloyl-ACP methyl ester carboxylesterase
MVAALIAGLIAAGAGAAGCGGSTASAAGSAATHPALNAAQATLPALPSPPPIVWSSCPTNPALQCGAVSVPIDYRHPLGGSIPLAVTRAPALDGSGPHGTLVFNPGGPGESGNQILPVALGSLPATVRQHFDIISFDPRGTGASDPLQCGTDPAAATSVSPVPSAAGQPLPGTAVFAAMAQGCRRPTASNAPFIDTVNTARDMDRIRQGLGLAAISFYGLSYGTALGSVYADLFPRRVQTMVLDGAVDVNASLVQQATEEAPAAEQSLDHLLATCASDPTCPLGPNPQSYFRSLISSLGHRPLLAPGGSPYPVTVGDLDTATLFALSVPGFTAEFYAALVAAHNGNGAPLRDMALLFDTDIDGAPLVDALWAITCNDAARHPDPATAGTLARSLAGRYPLIGAYAATYTMGGCVSWPSPRQPVTDLHPIGTPPILLIGNTGDPNTPLVNTRHLARLFPKASMVTWKGWGHTWLLSGPSDTCMQQVVATYLGGGGLPHPGTVCG